MKKDWDTVEVLRHARHDWLNKIQLIKGNLSLEKYDRVNEIIEEIVMEAREETKLSNLCLPKFTSLLLTNNWENRSFQLEFEVLEDFRNTKGRLNDDEVTKWTSVFFERLHSSCKVFHENHLSVTIEHQLEGIRFFFDFRGIITTNEPLMNFFKEEHSSIQLRVQEFSEQELALEVYSPFS